MKLIGWIYIIIGALTALLGILSWGTDIQLIIVYCGWIMSGIGILMVKR